MNTLSLIIIFLTIYLSFITLITILVKLTLVKEVNTMHNIYLKKFSDEPAESLSLDYLKLTHSITDRRIHPDDPTNT